MVLPLVLLPGPVSGRLVPLCLPRIITLLYSVFRFHLLAVFFTSQPRRLLWILHSNSLVFISATTRLTRFVLIVNSFSWCLFLFFAAFEFSRMTVLFYVFTSEGRGREKGREEQRDSTCVLSHCLLGKSVGVADGNAQQQEREPERESVDWRELRKIEF